MGGLKKPKVATPSQTSSEKGKEIKIISRSIVSISDVEKNPRLLKLLYVISLPEKGISEKALMHLLHNIEANYIKLGYNFIVIGGTPSSKEVLNDLTALKYTGLVELSRDKKLVITSLGKELLSRTINTIQNSTQTLKKGFEETWPKIAPIDLEVGLKSIRR